MDPSPRFAATLVVSALARVAADAASAKTPAEIGPDAVWKPPEDFRQTVTAACANAGKKFPDCVVAEMKQAGASPAALDFAFEVDDPGRFTGTSILLLRARSR